MGLHVRHTGSMYLEQGGGKDVLQPDAIVERLVGTWWRCCQAGRTIGTEQGLHHVEARFTNCCIFEL